MTDMQKTAGKDTEEFVLWCILRAQREGYLKGNPAVRLIEKAGFEIVESATPRQTGDFIEGERVRVYASKNSNPENIEECEEYNDQIGMIKEVLKANSNYPKGAVRVNFGRDQVLFHGTISGSSTGLYREKSASPKRKSPVELVYIKDPLIYQKDVAREEAVQRYMEKRTISEQRSSMYYTGTPGLATENKAGQLYFRLSNTAQRGARPTTFNLEKGRLLYIGNLGKRPGGWKRELDQLLAARKVEG